MTLKPLVCPNCGGSIHRDTMVCEYCGTKFAYDPKYNQQVITARMRVVDPNYRFGVDSDCNHYYPSF